jgi:hypothetical protein
MYNEDLNKQQRFDEQGGCFALVAFFFVATIFAVFLLLSSCSTKKSIATERIVYRDSLREVYHTAHDTTIYRDSFIREVRNDTLIIKEIKYIYQTKVEQQKEKEKASNEESTSTEKEVKKRSLPFWVWIAGCVAFLLISWRWLWRN